MADSGNVQADNASAVTVARVVGFVESSNNPFALRFEPRIYTRDKSPHIVSAIVRANNCSLATAAVLYSFSFGEYQIMGFELYSQRIRYSQPIGNYLSSRSAQELTFHQFMAADKLDDLTPSDLLSDTNRDRFSRMYNGPEYVDAYSARILDSLKHFGVR